jgi:5'-3' exonuclease
MKISELDEYVNTPEKDNLILIDALNFAFRYKHRGRTDFAADYLRTVSSFSKSYGGADVVLLADKKYSKYRKNLDEGYKGDRKNKYKDQTAEEKEQVEAFFEGYEKALELAQTQYPMLRIEYVEADDLAAYIVKEHSHKYTHTWLISSDGDWDLLLRPDVSRFSFVTRKEYTIDNFYDLHGCDSPEEYISIKVLQGDSGDSVVGIEGVGAKRAYNLVKEYGSAMDIFSSIPLDGKQKFVERINSSGDLILLNYELMDLLAFCEDAIVFPDNNNMDMVEEFCECLR